MTQPSKDQSQIKKEIQGEGLDGARLDQLLAQYPDLQVISALAEIFWDRPEKLIRQIADAKIRSVVATEPKVIAMYSYRLVNGGVERVMEILTHRFVELGYRVVLISDAQSTTECFSLPAGASHHVTPGNQLGRGAYHGRGRALAEILEGEQVDVLIYHNWMGQMLPWDMLVAKSRGVPFVIYTHGSFSMGLCESSEQFATLPQIYHYADGVICLSEVNRAFWKNFNRNLFVVNNPPAFDTNQVEPAALSSKNILWLGRIAPEKLPQDALEIFAKVRKAVPEARLQLVGAAESTAKLSQMKRLARRLKIADGVEFCGFQADVAPYLQGASLMLSTSRYEGYPMNLLEGKIFGLPIVLYDMPYLTLSQGNGGMFPVEQGDTNAAAQAIINLLTREELRQEAGRQARAHGCELATYDDAGVWRKIFASLARHREEVDSPPEEGLMWQTMLHHYRLGLDNRRKRRSHRHAKNPVSKLFLLVQGLFYCYQDHGFDYTYRQARDRLSALIDRKSE